MEVEDYTLGGIFISSTFILFIMEIGLLLQIKGEILYTEVLYTDPKIREPISIQQTGPVPDNKDMYVCWIAKKRVEIHRKHLGSLVVLTHDGKHHLITSDARTSSNELYCNGPRVVEFERHHFKVKPIRKCHERCIYP